MALSASVGYTFVDGEVVTATKMNNAPTLSGVASIAQGGTAGATAADARTNLGLGTMATQAANAVAITGGTVAAKLSGSGSAPTIAAGAAAGSGGTASISGKDTAGELTINTGTGCTTGAILATITFNTAYGSAPSVSVIPSSFNSNGTQYYVNSTTGTFVLYSGTVALADSNTFKYFYQVIGV